MSGACDACLRRSHLVGWLAGRIADVLNRPGAPLRGLLRLGEEELIEAVGGRRRAAARAFVESFDASAACDAVADADAHALCVHCGDYPGALLALDDPPVVLYSTCDGARLRTLVDVPAAAIVGTRRPSPYGRQVAYELGRGLGAAGVTVVSGLALGIDAEAHRGTLDAGGPPVAVLACGVDVPYPRRHRWLHERVREEGAVVSEMPPGVPPFRWSFPARNRIMAGLARMTVVVEAGQPSGTLITTGFAADLGREVGAVPGPITTWRAEGTNKLLKDGASPVCGPSDVLDALFGVGRHPRLKAVAPDLEPQLRRVLDAVEAGEEPDAIGRVAEMSAGDVRAALVRLELAGMVTRDAFGAYQAAVRGA